MVFPYNEKKKIILQNPPMLLYWPMQKKLLQLQPHILLSKYHRRPGQTVYLEESTLTCSLFGYFSIIFTSHELYFSSLPLSVTCHSRNNTKPKQESQFDFKPPQAAQVRRTFLIILFITDCCFQSAWGLHSNVSLDNSYWEAVLPWSVCWRKRNLLVSFLIRVGVVSAEKHFQHILIETSRENKKGTKKSWHFYNSNNLYVCLLNCIFGGASLESTVVCKW